MKRPLIGYVVQFVPAALRVALPAALSQLSGCGLCAAK
jgi:hypothetical protein